MSFLKIAWFEYFRRIRSKWFIIGTFGMPLLIMGISIISGVVVGSGSAIEMKHFGVIDETFEFGDQLLNALDSHDTRQNALFDLAVSQGDFSNLEKQFDSLVADKVLVGYFVIPRNFEENEQIRFYGRSGSNIRITEVIKSELKDILIQKRVETAQLPQGFLEALFFDVDVSYYEIGSVEEQEKDELVAEYIAPFIFMFLLFLGIFTGGQLLLRAVLEERSSRVIEVLLSTVSYNDLMAGKILGLGLLGLTQSAIYLLVIIFAGNYYNLSILTPTIALLYLAYFILGYLLYSGIYIGVGALFDSEQEAQQAIQIITFIAIIPMVLWTLVIENPNSVLVNVLSYFPLVTPFFMMIKVSVGETTTLQVCLTLLVMIISVFVSIKLASKIFRTGILLYGKRITIPEIIRWMRA